MRLSRQALTDAVESALQTPVEELVVDVPEARLYSQVYRVDAMTRDRRIPLMAKVWSSSDTFQTQVAALERARHAFSADAGICIPYIGHDSNQQILIMQRIQDSSLESLAHIEMGLRGLNLYAWRRRMEQACFSTGRWLGAWHRLDRGEAPLAELFGNYLEHRSEHLDMLDAADRDRLLKLVAGLPSAPVAAAHGDFSPWNVLWSQTRITVLDFGVGEWDCISPSWDYQTMMIGLLAELKFSTRSPGRLFNWIIEGPLGAFERGYGPLDDSLQVRSACGAIRHLVSYASDRNKSRAFNKRADWHRAEIRRALHAVG